MVTTEYQSAIEEFLLVLRGEEPERYNCSSKSIDEWYKTGQQNTFLATYYITTSIIFELIALPVLYIISRKDLISNSCYHIMFFIGIIEVTELVGSSFWPGISTAIGGVYCTYPISSTILGKIGMAQWLSGTCACILLAINRLVDLYSKSWTTRIFDKPYKIRILIFICLIYGTYGSLFYDTIHYNSFYLAPLINPIIGDTNYTYSNYFLPIHNFSVCLILCTLYFSICISWYYKRQNYQSTSSTVQKQVFIQSILISLVYSLPAGFFLAMLYIPNCPKWFFFISDLTYQLSGGIPFILHMVLNKTIRVRVMKLFRIRNYVAPKVQQSNNLSYPASAIVV